MRTFFDRLFEATGWLAGLFMIGTLLAVLSSIFGRILPVLDLHGADAYAGYCMATSAFLALATTLRRGEHIRVTLIINRLSDAGYRRMDIFCHVVALVVSSALAWYSIQLVLQSLNYNDISTGLDATPLWIPQIGMAVGTTVLALAFVAELVDLLAGRKVREESGEMARTE
ncbi:TRAP transporter small permease [Propionivibrio dicarboxylicus]|uniref:TRAP transporter small permease protein n=1 Tax=Propionivibrio dicarboxylicus TaxID=83767 RepID=A0A1G7YAA7_9RHOO|nr:TRAP transporter small permease subunit [Propionivibrio dicarboxylicus]SDG93391.1 TRAP-type C4-dicarboxylate transport system, small permease component [Propionivibrio dicarboxylicus]